MRLDWRKLGRAARRAAFVRPSLPTGAQFEVTNACNLACKMCPRRYHGFADETMSMDTYRKLLDRLPSIETLCLVGWGEPLMHPEFAAMVAAARDRGIERVSTTTNGALLDADMAGRLVVAGLTYLRVSIDAVEGSGHRQSCDIWHNVRSMADARGAGGLPQITVASTLHANSKDALKDLIDHARDAGADDVALMRLNPRFDPSVARPGPEQEQAISEWAERYGADKGIPVGTPLTDHRSLRRCLHRFGTVCRNLLDSIYVTFDGHVTPCCALPRYCVGDLLEQPIEAIWTGEAFQDFRSRWKQLCSFCDVFCATFSGRTQAELGEPHVPRTKIPVSL